MPHVIFFYPHAVPLGPVFRVIDHSVKWGVPSVLGGNQNVDNQILFARDKMHQLIAPEGQHVGRNRKPPRTYKPRQGRNVLNDRVGARQVVVTPCRAKHFGLRDSFIHLVKRFSTHMQSLRGRILFFIQRDI